MPTTYRVKPDPAMRPLPPLRFGDTDRRTPMGDCPKPATFRAWTGAVVSKRTQRTPGWLKEYRSLNRMR